MVETIRVHLQILKLASAITMCVVSHATLGILPVKVCRMRAEGKTVVGKGPVARGFGVDFGTIDSNAVGPVAKEQL